jgi:hypothetical protein
LSAHDIDATRKFYARRWALDVIAEKGRPAAPAPRGRHGGPRPTRSRTTPSDVHDPELPGSRRRRGHRRAGRPWGRVLALPGPAITTRDHARQRPDDRLVHRPATLNAGLADKLRIHLGPLFLGGGTALLAGLDADIKLERADIQTRRRGSRAQPPIAPDRPPRAQGATREVGQPSMLRAPRRALAGLTPRMDCRDLSTF